VHQAGASGLRRDRQSKELEWEGTLMRRIMATAVLCAVGWVAALVVPPSVLATEACESSCRPWWHLNSGARPTRLLANAGASGEIVLTATNLGDATADGETVPVVIEDTLPAHLELRTVSAKAGGSGPEERGPISCQRAPLRCTFTGTLPPYDVIEMRIRVRTLPGASSGELNQANIFGGDATSAEISRPVTFSREPTPFGVEAYELTPEEEGGGTATQAGSHPFQLTTTIDLNQLASAKEGVETEAHVAALAKDVHFRWPAGLLGNPDPLPRCSLAQFLTPTLNGEVEVNSCPPQTAVGVINVTVEEPNLLKLSVLTVPIFNIEPAFGQPARFGFFIDAAAIPVLIEPSLRSGEGEDYGLTVSTTNISQIAALLSVQATVWGVPNDPRHDNARGWGCLFEARGLPHSLPCKPSEESHPPAFLIMPTSCSGSPLVTSVEAESWVEPLVPVPLAAQPPMPTLDGCNRLGFAPKISAEPTTVSASAPSGLDFNIDFHDEGLTSATGNAQSQLKDTVVTLPEGLTINPSAGVGLGGCTEADYARETLSVEPGAGCPNDSKLGTVEIETPLLTQKIHGSLFIAQPYENPFPESGHPNGSLVALYIVAKNPETGVLVKLAGEVTPNPVTGQLTTTFSNNPQLPFDHFNFHFREGQQAPLITPPLCGTYSTQAQLTPWSEPTESLTETSSFTISKGYDGGACPTGGAPPFHPGIASGTLNNNAGAFSPFYLHLTRTDGEQEISGFSTDLPAGLTGDLSGIPFCPEEDIVLARAKTGAQEEADPSCPVASQIGHTLVGTGVGAVLAYVPGKLYLAGPYNGDPFSLVSVTSATVGPFDLGTVVLRFALRIDPNTGQVSVDPTASEPIPTVLHGIVTHVRDIRVYVNRPGFILNPTSCNPLAISSTLNSSQGQSATISSPFQASNCANLTFKPSFKVSTSGKTSRLKGASLTVKLSYPGGSLSKDANIAKVKVDLPKQLPSRLTTLQKACPDSIFNHNPAACPTASIVGHASAVTPILPVPLTGPAYFVSHGGAKFPELIIVLQGYGVTIDLRGETFINSAGITSSTFRAIPDEPVTNFSLTLPQGPDSALAANGNLCKARLRMPTTFVAQNGMTIKQDTPVTTTGCPKARKSAKHRRKKK
jgi:hypothetical protein